MTDSINRAALILVDIQNDFCPSGALAVPEGDQIVPIVNELMPLFDFIIATQDWHPKRHISFAQQGGSWPPHCIQETPGAELHPNLAVSSIDLFLRKAVTETIDAYSGFEARDSTGRSLDEVLRAHRKETIFVVGLATDYCVKATVLDGLRLGYRVYLIKDAVRAVDVNPGDGRNAIDEMKRAGAQLLSSRDLLNRVAARSAL